MERRKRIWQFSTTAIFLALGALVCIDQPDPWMGIIGIVAFALVACFIIYKAGAL